MNHQAELEALVELARTGNMRRAADSLGVSQSTLSEALIRIEAAYGAPLFERDRRGSRPTVYGTVVVEAAERALVALREARREIGLIKGAERGRLAIGAEPGFVEPFLAPVIAQGLARNPALRYRVQAADSSSLVTDLREKRIDFFFGVQPDIATRGVSLREIGRTQAVPFVRAGHPLAGERGVTLATLTRHPLVQGPGPRWLVRKIAEELRRELGRQDFQALQAAVVVHDFGVLRSLVRRSDAVAFASAEMLSDEIARGDFVCLELPAPQRDLMGLSMFIGTLDGRSLPPSALALIAALERAVT
jgi:DNA-binding transcriptional LysR family regulator